ncbi:MAG TPA: hypothetical protein VEY95_01085 [Azospirillaceae bacterium]|nr:hypothetical protein [Azospirillaceae bacterium]
MDSYVVGKVRAALAAANGRRGIAQRILIDWAEKDQRLLLGLTRTTLPALVGSLLERATRSADPSPTVPEPAPQSVRGTFAASRPAATRAPVDPLADLVDRDAPRFGLGVPSSPPPEAGRGHAAALRALAAVHARRRGQ